MGEFIWGADIDFDSDVNITYSGRKDLEWKGFDLFDITSLVCSILRVTCDSCLLCMVIWLYCEFAA